jgi:D-3-phosphoglycerate dehydrogenase / 2-oxoglutarate reductase
MKVVFLDTVHPILEERLSKEGFQCIDATTSDLETCQSLVQDAVGIVIRSRFPMHEAFLKYAPKLQFIARSGAGMENIDETYCRERNIQLFNAPEGNRNAVGEHALGMLLALLNNFIQGDQQVRKGIWDREGNRGEELDRKTVGIIGYGNNGRAFAKKLRGFDSKVLVYDKYLENLTDEYVTQVTLERLYQEADVISFHIPQNEETLYWVNEHFFESISKPIYLLNLSRGKIVDTQVLLNAISKGQVKGAGLDVLEFEKASFENFSDSDRLTIFQELIASNKVILTPHVGGWTTQSYYKLSDVLAGKILAFYR